jgi:hypothetical protein
MRLYVLSCSVSYYDCVQGFVIRARSQAHARKIASENSADEGSKTWLDPKRSTCNLLRSDGETGIILRDFSAA